MQYIYKYVSPLGEITAASDGKYLNGLWFAGQKYFASTLSPEYREETLPVFEQTKKWLDCYFSGGNPGFTPPIALGGSSFQLIVWEILRHIPYGETVTYGEIASKVARQLGRFSMSAQAVGGAVARNPVSIIIPCHRVVGSGGSLTGYAGGLSRKMRLLQLEGAL